MAEKEKERKTKIVRKYSGKYWVDVEVLMHSFFKGAQWKGPDEGNQSQETIIKLLDDEDLTSSGGGTSGDASVSIEMVPPGPGSTSDSVVLATKESAKFLTRGGQIVRRVFVNVDKDEQSDSQKKAHDPKRDNHKNRIQSNNIDAEFLNGGKGGNPPEDPDDYKQAVEDSKDPAFLWLDINIPKKFELRRARRLREQAIKFSTSWAAASLPGASKESDLNLPHVTLDPYQVVVNFGPDSLAAEFYAGAGPKKR